LLNEIPLDGLRDRVLALRSMPWSRPLDDDALSLMAEHARNRRLRRGEQLTRDGEPVEAIYIVLEGAVEVTVGGTHLARAMPGNVAGITSLFARDPRGARSVAIEDTLALEIPGDALFAAYEESFALVRNLLLLMSRGILSKRDHLPRPSANEPIITGTDRQGEISLVERVLEMRQTPLFTHVNLDAVFELARTTAEARVARGAELWRRGDPSRFWLRHEYGRVRCENAEAAFTEVGAGYVLGPLDCWAEQPRSYRATAVTDLIVHPTELADMLRVLETHHDLAMDIVALVCRMNLPPMPSPGQPS
jgi:CRP-like cAMP-binding protein